MSYVRFGKDDKGLIVYDFNKRIHGVNHRDRIHCAPQDVDRVFAEWLEALRRKHESHEVMLFDIINQHLKWCEQSKPQHHVGHMKRYFQTLRQFLGTDRPIDSVKESDVLKFLDWRRLNPLPGNTNTKKEKLTESTLLRCVGALSGFFKWAKKRGLMKADNPCHGLELKDDSRGKRDVDLTPEQIREVLSSANQTHQFTFLLLLLTAGLRVSEALKLTWSDVDFTTRKIHLPMGKTKSKKARSVDLPDVTAAHLASLERMGPFVINIAGEPVKSMKCFWRRARLKLSFPEGRKLCLHGFKHNFITWASRANVDRHTIQHWAGHSDPATTGRYDHYRPGDKEAEKMEFFTEMLSDRIRPPTHIFYSLAA